MTDQKPLTYRDAGVDIDEGARLVDLIGPEARRTARAGTASSLGGFAASFDLKAAGYSDPILLVTTDGVGTKLKLAIESGRHETIGVDLVAMCVNDLLAQGGEPLLFLDYYATGKLDADQAAAVIRGIAVGCQDAGCALVGGETAEMPGLYAEGDYDLAGFAVGAAERGRVLPGAVRIGDVLLGLASSGPHSNGYSLIRRVVERAAVPLERPAPFAPDRTLAEALLTPTRIYIKSVLPLVRAGLIKGLAHITGGGLEENTPRALPKGLEGRVAIDWSAWQRPSVFDWLIETGATPEADARRTYNLGIGMVAIVDPACVDDVCATLRNAGETVHPIGEVAP
jgi:phosphoribosylaminoimidazole synthetase